MFSGAPIELPTTITIFALPIPYTTHRKRPTIKTIRKRIDASAISFVFNAFLICYTALATVNAVAKSLMTVIRISSIILHFIQCLLWAIMFEDDLKKVHVNLALCR
jgi:hypothetical protein